MNIKNVKIADIKIVNRLWDIDDNTVDALVESIKEIGLKTYPTVREDNGQYILIAGNHRIEAYKRLGFDSIDVSVDVVDENYAILHEIDENLSRRAVHYAERGYQMNVRKKVYDLIHGQELSRKHSFKRYFKDVESVINGKKRSKYDYTLFREEELNYDYIKDRCDTNNMEDLFGVYTDSNGNECLKTLTNKDYDIARKLYPIMKAIDENVEYVPDFLEDVAAKLNLADGTVQQDLYLGKNIDSDDVKFFKELGIDKQLAMKIATDDKKQDYKQLLNGMVENEGTSKGINSFVKKAMAEAKKEVVQETGSTNSTDIFNKVSEIIKDKSLSNKENGLNTFSTKAFNTVNKTNNDNNDDMDNDNDKSDSTNDMSFKVSKIAEIMGVDINAIKTVIAEDKLHITVDLKEINYDK